MLFNEEKFETMVKILQERGYQEEDIDNFLGWWKERRENQVLNATTEWRIGKILSEIGINPRLKGAKYLKTAIKLKYDQADEIKLVTRQLYPMIAQEHEVSLEIVERNMRYAILSCWNVKDITKNNNYSEYTEYNVGNKKPTVSQFIETIAIYLKQEDKIRQK